MFLFLFYIQFLILNLKQCFSRSVRRAAMMAQKRVNNILQLVG